MDDDIEVLAQRLTVVVRETLHYLVDTGASLDELEAFVETFECYFRDNLREALFRN